MKLTNAQAEAIVSLLRNSFNDKIHKEQAQARKCPKIISQAKKHLSALEKIPEPLRKKMYLNKTEGDFINALLPKTKLGDFNWSDKKNKVIIEAIECENLKHLYEKLELKINS